MKVSCVTALATLSLSFLSLRLGAEAQSYTITDVGVLKGDTFAQAAGVGDAGKVVGSTSPAPNAAGTAFLWTRQAGMHPLRLPVGFSNSAAWAINDVGDTVGQAAAPSGYLHAILWKHDGSVIDLGVPKGSTGSTAYDINDLDEVIGWGNTAFVWKPGEGFHNLGTLPGGSFSVGWRVNLRGEAVGFGDTPSGYDHAFLWIPNRGMKDLGVLPGGSESEALGNNNFHQVVGASDSSLPNLHAVLWTENGNNIIDLGVLPGFVESGAYAINDAGEVVGDNGYPTGHAFRWTQNTGMLDLNDLIPPSSGWVLNVATFVSPEGQISGYGTINGQTHGFLLTPTGQ